MAAGRTGAVFDPIMQRGAVSEAVAGSAWLEAMLATESALAGAEAELGLIPTDHAAAIARACREVTLDPVELVAGAAATGMPVVPMLEALRQKLDPDAARSLHRGATSQDVMDTAGMLVAARALDLLGDDLRACADAVAGVADAHRATPMAARTLLQQALPTTFGAVAAGWLVGLDSAIDGVSAYRRERAAVQFGGAAGTTALLGTQGIAVQEALARRLELSSPAVPWHTERSRMAELAGTLGVVAAAVSHVATDIVLLSQTEVAELRDVATDRGGSSTLPQKRNPIAAVAARACAMRAPGLVATVMTTAGEQELQRAAGAWHAEWPATVDLLRVTGSAAAWLRDAVEHLDVDAERMRRNLDIGGETLMAERVRAALDEKLGPAMANTALGIALAASREGSSFSDALVAALAGTSGRDSLDSAALAELLDPTTYLGSAEELVTRALENHGRARES